MQTYLVEHYRPGHGVEQLRDAAELVQAAALALQTEGRAVQHLRTTIVPGDEAFLSVFEADSESAVRDTYTRAGVLFERISPAVSAGELGSEER